MPMVMTPAELHVDGPWTSSLRNERVDYLLKLVQSDPDYNEGAPRTKLLALFNVLGDNPLVGQYRCNFLRCYIDSVYRLRRIGPLGKFNVSDQDSVNCAVLPAVSTRTVNPAPSGLAVTVSCPPLLSVATIRPEV